MLQSPSLGNMMSPFHLAHAASVAAAAQQQESGPGSSPSSLFPMMGTGGSPTVSTSSPSSAGGKHSSVSSSPQSSALPPTASPLVAMGAPPPPPPPGPHHGGPHHIPPHMAPPPHLFPHPHGHHPHLGMEPPRPRFMFKMPRVVPNQKEKFESDDLMKRHSREGEVRYTAYRDRPLHERQNKFICALRDGHAEIAFISTGFNVLLSFDPTPGFNPSNRQCDFEKEPGKVHIRSPMILNGVCVRWKGYLDMERLDGVGCMEFDEETAAIEDAILRDTVEAYNRRIKEFEEHTKARSRQIAAFQQAAAAHAAHAAQAAQQQAVVAAAASHDRTTPTSTATSSTPAVTTGGLSPTNNNSLFQPTSHSLATTSSPSNSSTSGGGHLSESLTHSTSPPVLGATSHPSHGHNIHADLLEARRKHLELSVASLAMAGATSPPNSGSSAASSSPGRSSSSLTASQITSGSSPIT